MKIEEKGTKTSFYGLKRQFCNKCDDSRMIKNMNRQGANFSEPIKIKRRTGRRFIDSRMYSTKSTLAICLL